MILESIALAGLLALSAFFSGSEIAYTSVNVLRLRRAAESGKDALSARAWWVYQHFDSALSAILIGNNLANVASTSIMTVLFLSWLGDAGATWASVVMTVAILLFGEITPKLVCKEKADAFVRVAAWPMTILMKILSPIGAFLLWIVDRIVGLFVQAEEEQPTITEEEFSAILDTAEDEGVLDEEQTDLMQSALAFDDRTLREILTPRIDIAAVDIADAPKDILRLIADNMYSRMPVYEDTIDNVIGILYTNHFLREMAASPDGFVDVRGMLNQPLVLYQSMNLNDAMHALRRQHVHMAIVQDEYGGVLGIVTMEDLLEQLVGEIWDESDDIVEDTIEIGENVYEVEGTVGLHEFFDDIDFDERNFESEYTTVGGWAVEMLDEQPEVGKSFEYENLRVTVLRMDGIRVERLRVEVLPREDDALE